MSFFSGDVIAKEQLPGCIGSGAGAPPIPPVVPPLQPSGWRQPRRRPLKPEELGDDEASLMVMLIRTLRRHRNS